MVCDVFPDAEVGVFWPPELISSIGTKPLPWNLFGGTDHT